MDALTELAAALAGRYSVVRGIGAGGMATVYVARDVKHDRDVAIKVLHRGAEVRFRDRSVYYWSVPAGAMVVASFESHSVRVLSRPKWPLQPSGFNASGALVASEEPRSSGTSLYAINTATGAMAPFATPPTNCRGLRLDRSGTRGARSRMESSRDVWLGVVK